MCIPGPWRDNRSLQLFAESLELLKASGSASDSDLAVAHNNIARVLLDAERYGDAYDHIEMGPGIAPQASQNERYFRAFLLATRAEILCSLGRATEALGDAETALAVREGDGNKQRIAASYSTLGRVYLLSSATDAGVMALRKSLELHEEVYGEDHPELRKVLSRLAAAEREAGHEAAAEAIEEWLTRDRSRFRALWPEGRRLGLRDS